MRKTSIVFVILLALGLMACSGKYKPESPAAADDGSAAAETGATGATADALADCEDQTGGDATVTMSGFAFVPDCLRVSAGSKLAIVNEDQSAHSFLVEGGAISETLDVGDTVKIEAIDLAPGTYAFNCGFHPPMQGTLVVE